MGCHPGKEIEENELFPNEEIRKKSKSETILVIGASGCQGGQVMISLLWENKFKVRGLTRKYNKLSAYED